MYLMWNRKERGWWRG